MNQRDKAAAAPALRLPREWIGDLLDEFGGPPPPEPVPRRDPSPVLVAAATARPAPEDAFVGIEQDLPRAATFGLGKTVPFPVRPAPARRAFCAINLSAHVNHKLAEPFPGAEPGNDLSELPAGPRLYGGVPFTVGAGLVYLGGARAAGPRAVTGIVIGGRLGKLHFLHSCGFGHGARDGEPIARFVVSYDDGTTESAAVSYGRDVLDWWSSPGGPTPSRAAVGWEGENAAVREWGARVRLFVTSWDNPHPEKKIVSLDYVAAATDAVPFCVAVTAER